MATINEPVVEPVGVNVKLTEQPAVIAPVVYVVPLNEPAGHVPPTVELVV
jgi:hypothetical protein